jgi:integrase
VVFPDRDKRGDVSEGDSSEEQRAVGAEALPHDRRPRSSRKPNPLHSTLKHTRATLLLLKNVHPKFVQKLLGHATIAITLDTYSHVLPSMGDQTARAMQDALT